jgi:hypothetical protein
MLSKLSRWVLCDWRYMSINISFYKNIVFPVWQKIVYRDVKKFAPVLISGAYLLLEIARID